ncbi:MAG: SH3 domain-containing protein, partial [Pseudomonadota bacterium]|nr:SH3 domain-containing protein [Pseudomonadota bacterium]
MLKKLVLSLVILALKTNLVYSLEYMEFSDDFPLDALVIGAGVRVRAAANIKAKIIKKVAFGTYVQLLARSRHSDKFQGDYAYYWLKVKLPSQHIGWIWGRYIVYYYPTKQNLECNIPYQGKKYELRLVEVEYPRYIDFG